MSNPQTSPNFKTSIGGQALMEGIMMRGPQKICCAVRKPDGTIDLSYDTVTTHWYNRVPLVRFTGIDNWPHTYTTELAFMIYDEFFSRFARKADGTLEYLV